MDLIKSGETIVSDCKRVILRQLGYHNRDSLERVISYVLSLSEVEASLIVKGVEASFTKRHRLFTKSVLNQLENLKTQYQSLENISDLSKNKSILLGALCTMEYSFEAAALFNPSIVSHPDQSACPKNGLKFLMSLRATGEGHISSLTFREGIIDENGIVKLQKRERYAELPESTQKITDSKYETQFREDSLLSERVIFPEVANESNGIEDFRFVKFTEDDGSESYYGTYTGYDGNKIQSKIIETKNFLKFTSRSLEGEASHDKGMALFPRKINGHYAMISRSDGESLFLNYSDDLYRWDDGKKIATSKYFWEQHKIGNCGSPIETPHGWILITHGVGPLRKYSIGVMLLDLDDPSIIIGRTKEPLYCPTEEEREGYVPNVVYTCGAIVHNGFLVIPYAASDLYTRFLSVNLDKLVSDKL